MTNFFRETVIMFDVGNVSISLKLLIHVASADFGQVVAGTESRHGQGIMYEHVKYSLTSVQHSLIIHYFNYSLT